MCLGIPGKILSIQENPLGMTMGRVSFGGITKDVCLAYVPEVRLGDFVIVHVGFALSTIDEEQAQQIFHYLQMNRQPAEGETHEATDAPSEVDAG